MREDSRADLAADGDPDSLSTSSAELENTEDTLDFINPKGVRFIPKRDGKWQLTHWKLP